MAIFKYTEIYGGLTVRGITALIGSATKNGEEIATEDWVIGKNYITSASLPNLSNYPDHINLASGKEYRINGTKLSKTDIELGNVANVLQAKAPGSNKGETQNKTLTYSGGNASTFKVLEVKTDGTIEERIMTMPGVPTVGSDANKLVVTGSGGILSTPNAPSEDSVVILKGSTGNYSIVDYTTLKSYLAVPDVHSWAKSADATAIPAAKGGTGLTTLTKNYFLRVNDDADSWELRSAVNVRSDIGANNASNLTLGYLALARITRGATNTFLKGMGASSDVEFGSIGIGDLPTGVGSTQVALGNHGHGNISNLGAIGSVSSKLIITGASGVLQAAPTPAEDGVVWQNATNGNYGILNWANLKASLSLSNVNNTSDADKPISTAAQTALNNKQPKIVTGITATAVGTAKKSVTVSDSYTPVTNDLIAITFTNGNTANSVSLNINSSGDRPILLGGGAPTGASGTGALYLTAGSTVLFLVGASAYYLLGSQDITDANTTYSEISDANIINKTHSTGGLITGRRLEYFLSNTTNTRAAAWDAKQDALTNPVTGTGTTNQLAYWTGANTIGALAVATYPSLTELSYVKGLSSAVQTQLNNRVTTNTNESVGGNKKFTGQTTLESASTPLYINRLNNSAGIYAAAVFRKGDTSAAGVNNEGIGFYFQSRNSAKTLVYAGLLGGRIANAAAGSEIGEVLLNPSYLGNDPYNRPGMRVRARAANIADVYTTGHFYSEAGQTGTSGKKVATEEYVDNKEPDLTGLIKKVSFSGGVLTVEIL